MYGSVPTGGYIEGSKMQRSMASGTCGDTHGTVNASQTAALQAAVATHMAQAHPSR